MVGETTSTEGPVLSLLIREITKSMFDLHEKKIVEFVFRGCILRTFGMLVLGCEVIWNLILGNNFNR